MTRRHPHLHALRTVATIGLAAVLCGLTAQMSHALALPEPVSTAVGGATTDVKGVTGGLGLPVPGATTSVPSASTAEGSGTNGSTGSGSSAPAGSAVVDLPAATVCLIPTGTSSPAVEVDLKAAGVDLSSPLVKQFPQALTKCPKGAVPAGDHVISVDAAIKGLLGACVRVTSQVVPAQTTLVVLDRDLIKELTSAEVPLDRLVVPCPRAAATPPAGNGPSSSSPARPGTAVAGDPADTTRPGGTQRKRGARMILRRSQVRCTPPR